MQRIHSSSSPMPFCLPRGLCTSHSLSSVCFTSLAALHLPPFPSRLFFLHIISLSSPISPAASTFPSSNLFFTAGQNLHSTFNFCSAYTILVSLLARSESCPSTNARAHPILHLSPTPDRLVIVNRIDLKNHNTLPTSLLANYVLCPRPRLVAQLRSPDLPHSVPATSTGLSTIATR